MEYVPDPVPRPQCVARAQMEVGLVGTWLGARFPLHPRPHAPDPLLCHRAHAAVYETTAWSLVRQQLADEVVSAYISDGGQVGDLDISFHNMTSRRVMMPGFIGQYSVMGNQFFVAINGATGASALCRCVPVSRGARSSMGC